jgi:hypothetical protein
MYGELQGDNILWLVETLKEAMDRFPTSPGEDSLLIKLKGRPTQGTFYDYITHEYDPFCKDFIPYRPVYYCLLNPDKTIQAMTLHKPQPPLDTGYTQVLRHMAEMHQKNGTPVDRLSMPF